MLVFVAVLFKALTVIVVEQAGGFCGVSTIAVDHGGLQKDQRVIEVIKIRVFFAVGKDSVSAIEGIKNG